MRLMKTHSCGINKVCFVFLEIKIKNSMKSAKMLSYLLVDKQWLSNGDSVKKHWLTLSPDPLHSFSFMAQGTKGFLSLSVLHFWWKWPVMAHTSSLPDDSSCGEEDVTQSDQSLLWFLLFLTDIPPKVHIYVEHIG